MAVLSKIATGLLIIGWLAWVIICEKLRNQVNDRLAPEDRFQKFQSSLGSGWWGRGGLWNKHSELYPRSALRVAFWIDVVVVIGAAVAAILTHAR